MWKGALCRKEPYWSILKIKHKEKLVAGGKKTNDDKKGF